MIKINKIKIDGKIVSFSKPLGKEDKKYYFMKIKQSRVFNGEMHSTFFDVKVYNDKLKDNKELYVIGKKVMIEGRLDSYFKDENLIIYIVLESISNNLHNEFGDIISYDTDGTLLWHGKRCEKIPMSEKAEQELKDLIKEVTG